jgi:hypothetical protein
MMTFGMPAFASAYGLVRHGGCSLGPRVMAHGVALNSILEGHGELAQGGALVFYKRTWCCIQKVWHCIYVRHAGCSLGPRVMAHGVALNSILEGHGELAQGGRKGGFSLMIF